MRFKQGSQGSLLPKLKWDEEIWAGSQFTKACAFSQSGCRRGARAEDEPSCWYGHMLGDLLTGSVQELPMLCAALPTVLHRKWHLKPFPSKGLHMSQLVEKVIMVKKEICPSCWPITLPSLWETLGWRAGAGRQTWGTLAFCQFFLVHRELGEIWGFVGETPASFHWFSPFYLEKKKKKKEQTTF